MRSSCLRRPDSQRRCNAAVPDKLYGVLFRSFSSDAFVSVDDLLCSLAVVRTRDRELRRKLVFRVYEHPAGQLQRLRVENLLLLAYGETSRSLIKYVIL